MKELLCITNLLTLPSLLSFCSVFFLISVACENVSGVTVAALLPFPQHLPYPGAWEAWECFALREYLQVGFPPWVDLLTGFSSLESLLVLLLAVNGKHNCKPVCLQSSPAQLCIWGGKQAGEEGVGHGPPVGWCVQSPASATAQLMVGPAEETARRRSGIVLLLWEAEGCWCSY